jgi:hypothetical protein
MSSTAPTEASGSSASLVNNEKGSIGSSVGYSGHVVLPRDGDGVRKGGSQYSRCATCLILGSSGLRSTLTRVFYSKSCKCYNLHFYSSFFIFLVVANFVSMMLQL